MAVNLINIIVKKVRQNFGRVRLLGAKFEQCKFLKYSSNFFKNFELINYYSILLMIYKMANRNSPQYPPLQDQVPNQMRIGIEFLLDPDMPDPELILSPVSGDDGSHNFSGLFYRVHVEVLEEWANATNFMMDGLGFPVEELEITTNFRDFLLIINGNIWEKRIFRYITMVIEQLAALITCFCKLTNYHKTQWAE